MSYATGQSIQRDITARHYQNKSVQRAQVLIDNRIKRKSERVVARLTANRDTGKRCSACWHRKPTSEYYFSARMPDGRQAYCKVCQATAIKLHGAQWHQYRDAMRAAASQLPSNQ
jgi:hypothetical protein